MTHCSLLVGRVLEDLWLLLLCLQKMSSPQEGPPEQQEQQPAQGQNGSGEILGQVESCQGQEQKQSQQHEAQLEHQHNEKGGDGEAPTQQAPPQAEQAGKHQQEQQEHQQQQGQEQQAQQACPSDDELRSHLRSLLEKADLNTMTGKDGFQWPLEACLGNIGLLRAFLHQNFV